VGALFEGLTLTDTHQDLFRNIVSLRTSENLFDDLSDNQIDWDAAIQCELACKPSTFVSQTPIIDRPFEEAVWIEAIGFPFRNWARSRYSDETFGVWYGVNQVETSIYETVYHWRRGLLGDAGFSIPGVSIERRVHLVRCDAALLEFRNSVRKQPILIHPDDYTVTHQVGGRLHREGYPGLISKSARCNGDVYAILNPSVLSNPRPYCYLTYTLTADGVEVERAPGEKMLLIPLKN
jgi:hypothetical protein